MNSKYLIYALVDPFTKEIRYIGKSCSGLKRPRDHSKPSELKYDTHKVHWIKSLIDKGTKPEILVLQEYSSADELDVAEQKSIEFHKSMGCNLTNSDNGGKGSLGRKNKDSTKQKMSKKRTEHYDEVRKQYGVIPAKKRLHMYDNEKELKQCRICTSWLELQYFSKNRCMWDGLQYKCKECDTKQRRNYKKYQRKLTDSELAELGRQKCEQMNSKLTSERRKQMAAQPIICININTREIKRYASAKDAKIDGFQPTRISTAIKDESVYKGYRFAKDSPNAEIELRLVCDVISMNAKGVLMAELAEMQKEMGLSDEQVKSLMESKYFKDLLKEFY